MIRENTEDDVYNFTDIKKNYWKKENKIYQCNHSCKKCTLKILRLNRYNFTFAFNGFDVLLKNYSKNIQI